MNPVPSLTPASNGLQQGQGQQRVDRKAATSERRKVQMKWCEEQRFKLQREYDDLLKVRNYIDELNAELVKDSAWVNKMRQSISKLMTLRADDCPIPPGFFFRTFGTTCDEENLQANASYTDSVDCSEINKRAENK